MKRLFRVLACFCALCVTGSVFAEDAVVDPVQNAVTNGKSMVEAKNFDGAMAIYKDALRLNDKFELRRAYGEACYTSATEIQADVTPKLDAANKALADAQQQAYSTAATADSIQGHVQTDANGGQKAVGARAPRSPNLTRYDPNYPPLLQAQQDLDALHQKADKANSLLLEAAHQYKVALTKAPGSKDFDCTAHLALCAAANTKTKSQGKQLLTDFIKQNAPATEEEKKLFAACSKAFELLSK